MAKLVGSVPTSMVSLAAWFRSRRLKTTLLLSCVSHGPFQQEAAEAEKALQKVYAAIKSGILDLTLSPKPRDRSSGEAGFHVGSACAHQEQSRRAIHARTPLSKASAGRS
jgi:hypothetical protein